MSDDNLEEITDPLEKKVWDEAVDINVEFAQQVQIEEFYKYKLRLHLTNNQAQGTPHNTLNNNQALLKLSNNLEENKQAINKEYKKGIDTLSASQNEHRDSPRIGIMLETAKDNLRSLQAYSEYHGQTPASLKKAVLTLPSEEQATQEIQKPNEPGPTQ